MSGLTRGSIKTLALALVDSSSADPYFSSVIDTLADEANRQVYRLVVEASPEYFETVTSITWPSGTEYIDVTSVSYLGAEPYRLLSVIEKPTSGAVSSSNLPVMEWRAGSLHDRARRLHDSEYDYGRTFALQGTRLYVAPMPSSDAYVDIHWIPQVTAFASDNSEVLDGKAEPWGSAVAYCLAVLLNAKQEGQNGTAMQLWAQARADLQAQARTRSSGPKRVRYHGSLDYAARRRGT